MKDREAMQQAPEFTRGEKQRILRTYDKLHQNKLGAHWLWCAIERIANGEPESQVLAEFGYAAQDRSPPVETVDRAADFLEQYAEWIKAEKPDLERHPYLPELEQVAADLRSPPVAPARMLTDAEIYSCVGARSHDAQQLDDLLALFCKFNGLTLGAPPAGNTGEGEAR